MRHLPLLLVLIPHIALADPPAVQPIPPGDDVIVVVKKGEQAPFTGQLFDNASALRWANYLQQYRSRLTLDVEYEAKKCLTETAFRDKVLSLEREKYAAVTTDLQKKLTEAQKEAASPPWYQSTWFGFGLGIFSSVAIVGVTAALVNATK